MPDEPAADQFPDPDALVGKDEIDEDDEMELSGAEVVGDDRDASG